MSDERLCTLDELTELVETALAVDYVGAPTGRVRDVPDQRAIRWYITRGLVDRPVSTRRRMAMYGRRHLLQLVAIKRRQAAGRSLAEIQSELAGATDAVLAEVAQLPPDGADGAWPWPRSAADVTHSGEPPTPDGHSVEPLPRRSAFWADRPGSAAAATAASSPGNGSVPSARATTGLDTPADPAETPESAGGITLHGVRLAPGVILLIEGKAPVADPAAIQATARPLLDLLAAGAHASHEIEEK